jgi:hypothetical protein
MTDLIAIVSVVSGAAVAITVPWITAMLERKRLREQVYEARIDELRTVLDQAGIALNQAFSALPTWEVLGQDALGQDERSIVAVYANSRKTLEAVNAQAERLAIRLGEDSPVFTGYDKARRRLWNWHHRLIATESLKKIPNLLPEDEEIRSPRLTTDGEFMDARRAFHDSAREIVGTR